MRPHADSTLDPIDLDRMPSLEGLGLDYRTDPKRAESPRISITATIFQTAVLATGGAIVLRVFSSFVASDIAFSFACFLGVLLAALSYAGISPETTATKRHRHAALFLLMGPALWVSLVLITNTRYADRAYPLTIAAVLALYFLTRAVAAHFAAWNLANPDLDETTRTQAAALWAGSADAPHPSSPAPSRLASGIALYRRGLLVTAAALAAGFLAVLLSKALRIGVFAGMFGTLTVLTVFIVVTRRRSRDLGLRRTLFSTWDALGNYLTYNEHNTKAPGVLRSPAGRAGIRAATVTAALGFLTIVIVPSSSYFPALALITGVDPWGEVYQQSHEDEFPSPHPPSRAEVLRSMTPEQRTIYDHKETAQEQNAYLDQLSQRRMRSEHAEQLAQARRRAVIEIARKPEGWVGLAAVGAFQGRWLFLWGFTASIFLSVLVPPLILFFALSAIAGPLFAAFREELEDTRRASGSSPEQTPKRPERSRWDYYVSRIQGSDRTTVSGADRTKRLLRDHLWLGSAVHGDYPVLLHREILHEHAWFLGNSGSGKTALGLAPTIAQLIRLTPKLHAEEILRGRRDRHAIPPSIIVLDFKGEPYLFHSVRIEAETAGLPFKWFSNVRGHSTYAFNPFLQPAMAHVTLEQKTDILLRSLGLEYGEGYGPAHYSTAHANVLNIAMEQNPEIRSFAQLHDILQAEGKLKIGAKQRQDAGDLFSLINSLAKQVSLNVTLGDPRSETLLRHGIDLSAFLEQPQVLYFYLPAMLEEANVRRIGRLALYSLLVSAEVYEKTHGHPARAYVFIDEFQQIVSKNLELFLRQARSKGLAMILSNQTTSDLKLHDGDLAPIIRGNTSFKQYFAASDLNLARDLVDGSGEAFFWLSSETEVPTFSGRSTTSYTRREEVRPRLSRNDILDMTNHPTRSLADITRGSGYSQFSGRPFLVDSMFHITLQEKERREEEPWPQAPEQTLTVGESTGTPSPTGESAGNSPSAPADKHPSKHEAWERGLEGYKGQKGGSI
jgi:hypothetical protein